MASMYIDNDIYDGYAQISVRCSVVLRNEVEKLAKENGQSLAEWVRRAMWEKFERDGGYLPDYEEREERIDKVILKNMEEKK